MRPLHREIGVEVSGADVHAATEDLVDALREALVERQLVVLPGQQLSRAELVAFTRRFGTPEEFDESPFPDTPQVMRVSNLAAHTHPPPPYWHTDGLLQPEPPSLTFFYADQVPEAGGETLFLNAQRAYDDLPEAERRYVDALRSVQVNGVEHPLVRAHPLSGARALYADLGATVGVVGLEREEAVALFTRLKQHYERRGSIYRHRFRRGDLLIWDNNSTAHSATPTPDPSQPRVMLRTTVRGGPTS